MALVLMLALSASMAPTSAAAGGGPGGDAPPDIVVIMLDDVAADAMPRLLRRMPTLGPMFQDRGTRFPEAYGQDPLCCPGRAGFLSGLTSDHHGVADNDAALRFDPRMTVATAMRAAGYHTMIVGKYLNRIEGLADPTPVGWRRSAITSGGYLRYLMYRDGTAEWHGDEPADYSTDVFADATARLLAEAPSRPPRFLYLNPYATHGDDGGGSRLPLAADRHRGDTRCDDVGFRKTPAWNVAPEPDRAAWLHQIRPVLELPEADVRGWPLQPACEALLSVDEWVAQVVGIQRAQGRLSRTMFVLTADNGIGWGDQRLFAKRAPWVTRVPLYVHWPAGLGDGRSVNRTTVQNIDLAPTFVAIAGGRLGPYPGGPSRPDGLSFLPAMLHGEGAAPSRTALYEQHRAEHMPLVRWRALRTTAQHPCGRWLYVAWATGERELFDLDADPWQLDNVASRHGSMIQRLARELSALRHGRDIGAKPCADPTGSIAGSLAARVLVVN